MSTTTTFQASGKTFTESVAPSGVPILEEGEHNGRIGKHAHEIQPGQTLAQWLVAVLSVDSEDDVRALVAKFSEDGYTHMDAFLLDLNANVLTREKISGWCKEVDLYWENEKQLFAAISKLEGMPPAGTGTRIRDAAVYNKTKALEDLCTRWRGNAILNELDAQGNAALHYASRLGHADCVWLLCEYGADVNTTRLNGVTPSILAAADGHLTCLQCLANFKADLNATCTQDRMTALMRAAYCDQTEIIAYLLTRPEVDVNLLDRNRKTALEYCRSDKARMLLGGKPVDGPAFAPAAGPCVIA